jgi:hypothetical protein
MAKRVEVVDRVVPPNTSLHPTRLSAAVSGAGPRIGVGFWRGAQRRIHRAGELDPVRDTSENGMSSK